jgi:hypothetical protein
MDHHRPIVVVLTSMVIIVIIVIIVVSAVSAVITISPDLALTMNHQDGVVMVSAGVAHLMPLILPKKMKRRTKNRQRKEKFQRTRKTSRS